VPLSGETVGKFLIFETATITAAAVFDDHVDIIAGDITTADIAEILIFTVKRADRTGRHSYLFLELCSDAERPSFVEQTPYQYSNKTGNVKQVPILQQVIVLFHAKSPMGKQSGICICAKSAMV
jgi:hypothetical protein